MPTLTKWFSASTFQEVFSRLSIELPRLASDVSFSRRTSTSCFWSWWLRGILPAASTIKPEEREFVVDSRASVYMVSRKDLNKAEFETVRISRNPTTVVTANGEVLTKGEATVCVKELDWCFSKIHQQFFHSENSARNTGTLASGAVVRNHISSKMTGKSIATQRTMCPSFSLVYRQALQAHRYAVVVQDLATQWIQTYRCKTKTSQKTKNN